MTLALAMCGEILAEGGSPDDRLLQSALHQAGVRTRMVAWDNGGDWSQYEVLLVRSCWDYHLRAAEFAAWLGHLEGLAIRVWNPIPLLRWNMDKRYLKDLATRGIPTVPTLFRPRSALNDLGSLQEDLASEALVVKPVIGATAHGCRRIVSDADLELIPDDPGPWLVQPFLEEILVEGEWSLLWFAGVLSHAVLKTPRAGDFRVQSEWGGTVERRRPHSSLIAASRRVLHALPAVPLYARIDLVQSRGCPLLMELELIEPQLFLEAGDVGLVKLAEALSTHPASPLAYNKSALKHLNGA